jgi:hypothetical protein
MKPITLRLDRLETRRAPAVATWDGGGANANWTTAANWVGDVAPNPGDDLVFPFGTARLVNVNDFPAGTAFRSLKIIGPTHRLTGNGIALAAGLSVEGAITSGPANTPEIGLPLTLTADQTFANSNIQTYALSGPVNLNGHALTVAIGAGITIFGPITGSGSLTFSGGMGSSLTAESTFAGPTTVSGSRLAIDGTLPGPVTVVTTGNTPSTLSGTGTVGDLTVTGGELIPGSEFVNVIPELPPNSTLKTGNLSLGPATSTSFAIVFPGAANGLVVTGTVQVGGGLTVSPRGGIRARPGDRLTLISNDGTDAIVGMFANAPEGEVINTNGTLVRVTYRGGDGNDLVATVEPTTAFAVGAGAGGLPIVNVYAVDGGLISSFFAYASAFRGGVRVATGDVTGDEILDIITSPGPGGGPHIRVFDGRTFAVVREFMAYAPAFTGGVFVAASQITSDTRAEIITGAGAGGGPHVIVFDGASGEILKSFFAYDAAFRGGISVAGTDAAQYASPGSVITGAGPGGGPHVRVFNGATGELTREFFAYDAAFRGGVNVATRGPLYEVAVPNPAGVGAPNVILRAGAIVTAPASRGGPDVRLFGPTGERTHGFLAYDPSFSGGVTLAVESIDAGGVVSLVTGAGPGGGPHVKVWVANSALTLQSFFAFDPAFLGGVFVG